MEARPTDFRGITYRSKCEAMFALWLELRNSSDVVIEYEPDWAELKDYVPDFAVFRPLNAGERIPQFETSIEIIEYKPSRPTFTYVKDCMAKNAMIIETFFKPHRYVEAAISVYFGSVYSEDRGVFTYNGNGSFGVSSMDWMRGHEKTIREFRFDLEAEPC